MKNMKHFELGASIYVPATHTDLTAIAHEHKKLARSVIFCTEDSVNECDVPQSLKNIEKALVSLNNRGKVLKFIRVRNEDILESVLQMQNIDKIDGFVFPKITAANYLSYHDKFEKNGIKDNNFHIMPTLETKETFNNHEMEKLLHILMREDIKDNILSLRIGGNDLLNILGIRRSHHKTIYETPLVVTISNLVTIFKTNGFNLTAPVCEIIQDLEVLSKETPMDLDYGLFGKTAIHPDQIKMIESFYMVNEQDVEMSYAMLEDNAPAVFKMHGRMCEKATHSNWAREIIYRSNIYGIIGSNGRKSF